MSLRKSLPPQESMSETAPKPQPPTSPTVSSNNFAFEVCRPPAVSQGISRSISVPNRSLLQHLKGSQLPVCSFLSARVSENTQRASSPLPPDKRQIASPRNSPLPPDKSQTASPRKADTRIHQEADVTPVQKVIQLLEGVLEKGKGEKHDDQVLYASCHVQTCKNPNDATPVQTCKNPNDATPVQTCKNPNDGTPVQTCKNPNDATPCADLQAQGLESWISEKIMMAMNRSRTENLSLCTAVEYRLASEIAKLREELNNFKTEIQADRASTHNQRLVYDVLGGDSGSTGEQSTTAQVDDLIGHLTSTVTGNVLERLKNEPATSVLNSQTEQALKYLERIKSEAATSVMNSQTEQLQHAEQLQRAMKDVERLRREAEEVAASMMNSQTEQLDQAVKAEQTLNYLERIKSEAATSVQLQQAEELQQAMKDVERLKHEAKEATVSMLNSQTEQLQQAIRDAFQMLDTKFSAAAEKLTKPGDVKQNDVEKIHISMKEMACFSLDLAKEVRRDRQQRNRDYSEACERLTRLEGGFCQSAPNRGGPHEVQAVDSFLESFHNMAKPMTSEQPQTGSFETATV